MNRSLPKVISNGWWTAVFYELKRIIQDGKALLFLMLFPLLLTLLGSMLLAGWLQEEALMEPFDVMMVNQDGTYETNTIIRHFREAEAWQGVTRVTDVEEAEAMRALESNAAAAVIIVPEGFSDDLRTGTNTPVSVIGNPRQPLQSHLIRSTMDSAAHLVTAAQSGVNTVYLFLQEAGADREQLQQVLQKTIWDMSVLTLSRQELFEVGIVSPFGSLSLTEYIAVAWLGMFVMFSGLIGVKGLAEEREHGLLCRLMAQGTPPWRLLYTKWLALTVFLWICLVLLSLILLAFAADGAWLSGTGVNVGILWRVFVIGLASCGAISACMVLCAVLFRRLWLAYACGIMTVLLMALIGGQVIPLVYLPAFVDSVSVLSLHKWMVEGLTSALAEEKMLAAFFDLKEGSPHGETASGMGMSILVLLFAAVALNFVSWLRLRREGVRL